MNLILLEPEEYQATEVTLEGRRALHASTVLGARPGDTLRVGVVDGEIFAAEVLESSTDRLRLRLRAPAPPPAPTGVSMLLALPRPKVLRRVLAAAASMGVERIVLVNAARVERSYFDSPLLEPSAMRQELLLGLEQGRDTRLPAVTVERRFRPFVEDRLAATFDHPGEVSTRLLAHPAAGEPFGLGTVRGSNAPVVLAIGPEGGWVPFEVALLESAGFVRVGLGERILRVETALPVLFGAVMAARAG